MKAIIHKILLIFRDLFFHLRVAVVLHIGRKAVSKDHNKADSEESAERINHD